MGEDDILKRVDKHTAELLDRAREYFEESADNDERVERRINEHSARIASLEHKHTREEGKAEGRGEAWKHIVTGATTAATILGGLWGYIIWFA